MPDPVTLENGLRVVVMPMPHARSVALSAYVAAGSRFERPAEAGLSHFVEHLCFKGTERRPRPQDISIEIDAVGGSINAATEREYTLYYAKVTPQHTRQALDVLGERWTLLLVRNLLLGPQRFKDLLEGLPGIGTNLLARRLRKLESAGVVTRRQLPPPAGSAVYELTPRGRELEPAVLALARWGALSIGRPRRGETFRASWLLLSLRALFQPAAARGVSEVYELRIDDEIFHACINDGAANVEQGPAPSPDLILTCDSRTLLDLAAGNVSDAEAVRRRRMTLQGSKDSLKRLQNIFRLPQTRPPDIGPARSPRNQP